MDLSDFITVHARVRYVERVLQVPIGRLAAADGIDPDHDGRIWSWAQANDLVDSGAVEAALVTPSVVVACRLGASCVDLGNGYRAMITRGRVTTITSKAQTRQRRKHMAQPANGYVERVRSKGFSARRNRERDHDHA